MRTFGKICLYVIVSLMVSFLVSQTDTVYFDAFKNNLIPLLATLAAIYMTANSLVTIELNRVKQNYENFDGTKFMREIKSIFCIQIILIPILFVSFIFTEFLLKVDSFIEYEYYINILSNAFAIAVFGYFLEAIYDMGCSLFMLIDANIKKGS